MRFSRGPSKGKGQLDEKDSGQSLAQYSTLAFCLHLEVAQVGISMNFLQENA
jgi:hypothetical protein